MFRAAPIRAAPRANRRELKAIYKTHIDIVHIRREEHGRLFSVFGDGGREQTPSSGSLASQGEGTEQAPEGEEGVQIMDNSLQQQVRAKEQALKVCGLEETCTSNTGFVGFWSDMYMLLSCSHAAHCACCHARVCARVQQPSALLRSLLLTP